MAVLLRLTPAAEPTAAGRPQALAFSVPSGHGVSVASAHRRVLSLGRLSGQLFYGLAALAAGPTQSILNPLYPALNPAVVIWVYDSS